MASNNEVTLGYWGYRGGGNAGAIRSLLSYCGIPFKNMLYCTWSHWYEENEKLGFDYPNLPYLIDGSKKITESLAILHHIALRAGKRELIGDTDDKFIKVQTALGVISDFRNELSKLAWTKGDFKAEKEEAFTSGGVKKKMDVLEKNLEGKDWICGFFSIADFTLFENVELAKDMEPKALNNYNNLTGFLKRFGEIPAYKDHRQSKNFLDIWFPPSMATWTNSKSP